MATAADMNNPPASVGALKSTASVLVVGLAWAAAMLFVFGFWMHSKYEGSAKIVTNIFLLSGVVAAGLAAWQAFTLWLQKATPEQQTAMLGQQRRMLSYSFLAGGLGLIVLAFFLGIGKKTGGDYGFILDNFAETFGILMFGLIALGSGYFLQQPPGDKVSPIQLLVDKVPLLKLIQLVLGVLALGAFCYLGMYKQVGFTWFPELAALLCMSMLCFGCLLWLNTGNLDEFGIRLYILVFGGTTGFILFCMALGRAYLWRQDIFLGGIASWQSDVAWRFWLVAYILIAALALMFGSFNLARADIRTNVYLRRMMFGYDALAQTLLLIGILFEMNVVIYALVPFSYDWTKSRGVYDLSDSSKYLLTGLKQETNVYVLLPQNSFVYKDIRNLLDNCQALSSKLKIHYVNPDLDQLEYERLSEKFPAILPEAPTGKEGRGVLLIYGTLPKEEKHNTPHSFVPERKLFKVDQMAQRQGGKSTSTFKGEEEILKELKFLVQDQKKRKIYVLQGNDEVDINNEDGNERREFRDFSQVGIGILADKLRKDNYDITGLSFNLELPGQKIPNLVYAKDSKDKRKDIPSDCHTLIVAGVGKTLSTEILEAIERFMDRGGKMLVYLDVFVDAEYAKMKESGLESLLKRYGVEVANEFPLRLPLNQFDDPRALFASTPKKSENVLVKQFAGKAILMKRTARIVKPVEAHGRYKAETVLHLDFRPPDRLAIVEKKVRVLLDPQRFMEELLEDRNKLLAAISQMPISVAVAVAEKGDKEKEDTPRMVVFGDTEFITNMEMARSPTKATNYSFTVSAIEWMAEREGIVGATRTSSNFSLDPEVDLWRMILLPGWLMMLTFVGLGVGIWVVRRR